MNKMGKHRRVLSVEQLASDPEWKRQLGVRDKDHVQTLATLDHKHLSDRIFKVVDRYQKNYHHQIARTPNLVNSRSGHRRSTSQPIIPDPNVKERLPPCSQPSPPNLPFSLVSPHLTSISSRNSAQSNSQPSGYWTITQKDHIPRFEGHKISNQTPQT